MSITNNQYYFNNKSFQSREKPLHQGAQAKNLDNNGGHAYTFNLQWDCEALGAKQETLCVLGKVLWNLEITLRFVRILLLFFMS